MKSDTSVSFVVLVIALVVTLWFLITAGLAWVLEAVWDAISPDFYPDMNYWVAFGIVFLLNSIFSRSVGGGKSD